MRICYLDESGTPDLGGGTSHFVLLALSIQGETWKAKDTEISLIKQRFGLAKAEVHTGWMTRRYLEQEAIASFDTLGIAQRKAAVRQARDAFLIRKAALQGPMSVQEDRKNFRKTDPYIHLTLQERKEVLVQIANAISKWDDCRIFGECIDKRTFGGRAPHTPPYEEAFTQVVTRFHRYLDEALDPKEYGLLVQDHNDTVARRLTELMRIFHERGTRWTALPLLVETPLFVDSTLTSMVQVADVCAYATRRFCENGETGLFDIIYPKFNKAGTRLVGVRHYTRRDQLGGRQCKCRICVEH